MPIRFPEAAGQPYRPSNGTEGDLFETHWCGKCRLSRLDDGCDIRTAAHIFGIRDPDYPKAWRYDSQGVPICKSFQHIDDLDPMPAPAPRCRDTIDMFGGHR